MRRASTLACLSRSLITSPVQQNYIKLIQTTSTNSGYSRWFSTSVGSKSSTGGKICLSLGGVAVAVGATSLLVKEDAYAKEALRADVAPKEVVLYQYEACPFCNKVKAYLDYYDIPYKVVEVNPFSKKEIKWSEYKKVPILTVDGETLVDSSAIIDQMGSKLNPVKASSVVSTDDDEEKKWRRSYEKYTVKYAGAAAMYFVSKKLKKKYNITDERAALYDAAETWVDALDGREFLGGSKPNLADLAVFGVLRPIRYLRSGKDMVEHTRIGEWYSRMESAVGESSRIKA